MHSDWRTENVNKFADWRKAKFPLVGQHSFNIYIYIDCREKEMPPRQYLKQDLFLMLRENAFTGP